MEHTIKASYYEDCYSRNQIQTTIQGNHRIHKFYLNQSFTKMQTLAKKILDQACADSHKESQWKCVNPLWKREKYFIRLPFKKNEDNNSTKASHSGMNPKDLSLVQQECKWID